MENLINQVINNELVEFTIITKFTGSETYIFTNGIWHQKGDPFPFDYRPQIMAQLLEIFYSRMSTIYETVTFKDACKKEINFLRNKRDNLRKIRDSIADIDEHMAQILNIRIREIRKEIAFYETKILKTGSNISFTEKEIAKLFGYADFFFLIDEAYIVQNNDLKWEVRQSV